MTPHPDCGAARHGTNSAYVNHRCRCPEAIQAKGRYEKRRELDARTGRPRRLNPTGTIRRIHALQAIGWPNIELAARLGVSRSRVINLTRGQQWVTPALAARVAGLYRALSDMPGPSALTRTVAVQLGRVPPIGWDDDTIDDPAARPWSVIDDSGNVYSRAYPCARPGCRGWAVAHGRLRRGEARPRWCSDRCEQRAQVAA